LPSDKLIFETRLQELKLKPADLLPLFGKSVNLTCPECGGPITEVRDGEASRFRCQVGHGFSVLAILLARLKDTERTLWHLVSNCMESARLSGLLADQSRRDGLPGSSRKFERASALFRGQALAFQRAILRIPDGNLAEPKPAQPRKRARTPAKSNGRRQARGRARSASARPRRH
jgi:two-component system chemotaxis response regulator CheB